MPKWLPAMVRLASIRFAHFTIIRDLLRHSPIVPARRSTQIPKGQRDSSQLIYTAHSIPLAMAETCDYEQQLRETGRLVADAVGHKKWMLAYQSRSGPASQPWLEPDILDSLREIKIKGGSSDVVVAPIGFVSDHMEILFDLDTQARALAAELGLNMVRAQTVGTHPTFIKMIRDLIHERIDDTQPRLALGTLPPRPDACPAGCCPSPKRPVQNLVGISATCENQRESAR